MSEEKNWQRSPYDPPPPATSGPQPLPSTGRPPAPPPPLPPRHGVPPPPGELEEKKRSSKAPKPLPGGAVAIIEGELPLVVAQVEEVLARTRRVYRRGQILVIPSRVVRGDEEGRVRRAAGAPHAPLATEPALVELAMNVANFVRPDERTKSGWKKTDLPPRYAKTLLARSGDWPNIPDLVGLAETPIMRPDGTVAEASGYDEASGYLLGLAIDFEPVVDHPTREDAELALALLSYPLAEFPFVSEAARTVALSGMLCPLARPAMRTVPGHAFDAPTMGSGKSLLADLAAILATGRCASATQIPESEEEMRKLVHAVAIEADPLLVLDNAERTLRSGSLSAAMTNHEAINARLLGVTGMKKVPWSATVILTGNNLALAGDISTRFLRCRIDAKVEAPEERDGFKIDDLRAWVRDARAKMVCAALTLLRWGALLEPRERPKLRRFGRFEDYDRIIRTPLVALGCPDPAETRAELRAEDPERQQLVELLTQLHERFPDGKEFTAEDAVDVPPDAAEHKKAARAMGYRLRSFRGRVAAGLALVRAGEGHEGKVRWVVREGNP